MSKWTRIDDRLPEWSGTYLLWDGKDMCVCPFVRGERFGYGSDYFYPESATHWRPLPKAPQ